MTQPPDDRQAHAPGQANPPAMQVCPPFDPVRMQRQLWFDAAARWATFILVIAAILFFQAGVGSVEFWLLMLPVVILWIAINAPSGKTAALMPQINAWLESDPPAAETAIAQALERRPLQRQLRIQLYHRLALVRHGQSRLEESSALCRALLELPLGATERHRPQLLLMLTEARLLQNDLVGAYLALVELSRLKVGLVESLQHLALRTRYEVMAGYASQALAGLPRKIQDARMLPASQCGAMHLLLAAAARQVDDQPLYDWLMRRAQLLCEPEKIDAFHQGRMAFGVEKPLTVSAM